MDELVSRERERERIIDDDGIRHTRRGNLIDSIIGLLLCLSDWFQDFFRAQSENFFCFAKKDITDDWRAIHGQLIKDLYK